MNPEIRVPADAAEIIANLERAGYEAYVVGGCVRDSVLGREPEDWDITTSASPEQVKELFPRTIDTGIVHGTVTVLKNRVGYEVTTYRLDGEYVDGRHPKEVTFTASLEEDLKRRDFTINAMAYHPVRGLVDLHGGIEDLRDGKIRCVGNARERFSEDALRILRALRFASQLDFTIEEETLAAVRELAPKLSLVSAERIREELVKLLGGKRPEMLITAYETGVTAMFLPEWDVMMRTPQDNPHHCYDVGRHTVEALRAMHEDEAYASAEPRVRNLLNVTMLLHDVGKPARKTYDDKGIAHFYGHPEASEEMARGILRRLKFDNDTIAAVRKLILFHDSRFRVADPEAFAHSVRRLTNRVGVEEMPLLFIIQRGDIGGKKPEIREAGLGHVALIEEAYREIVRKQQCVSLRDLAVSGADLIRIGFRSGPELGKMLAALLEHVLAKPDDNNAETLLSIAREELAE